MGKTKASLKHLFTAATLFPRAALKSWKVMLPVWGILIALVWVGFHYNIDDRIVVSIAILIGLLSSAFGWLVALLATVPVVGPLIVKVLAIPLIWLLNALGYIVSVIAIKRGYTRDVLTYRALTMALIVGIIIGYILGHLV